jgi:hypothetical protein
VKVANEKLVVMSKHEHWPPRIVRCLNSNCGLTIAWILTMEGRFRGQWALMLCYHAERWQWLLSFHVLIFSRPLIRFSTIKAIIIYYLKHNYHIFVLHCLSNNPMTTCKVTLTMWSLFNQTLSTYESAWINVFFSHIWMWISQQKLNWNRNSYKSLPMQWQFSS